jgi:hypothetical protein
MSIVELLWISWMFQTTVNFKLLWRRPPTAAPKIVGWKIAFYLVQSHLNGASGLIWTVHRAWRTEFPRIFMERNVCQNLIWSHCAKVPLFRASKMLCLLKAWNSLSKNTGWAYTRTCAPVSVYIKWKYLTWVCDMFMLSVTTAVVSESQVKVRRQMPTFADTKVQRRVIIQAEFKIRHTLSNTEWLN